MNEQGIPQNSKERFKIADGLIRKLTSEGIPIEDIYRSFGFAGQC